MKKKITFLLIILSVLILTVLIFRIKFPSGISAEDAQKQIENSLEANGISEYEKIDLEKYEKQAGVDLSTYISYRFFIRVMISKSRLLSVHRSICSEKRSHRV